MKQFIREKRRKDVEQIGKWERVSSARGLRSRSNAGIVAPPLRGVCSVPKCCSRLRVGKRYIWVFGTVLYNSRRVKAAEDGRLVFLMVTSVLGDTAEGL